MEVKLKLKDASAINPILYKNQLQIKILSALSSLCIMGL